MTTILNAIIVFIYESRHNSLKCDRSFSRSSTSISLKNHNSTLSFTFHTPEYKTPEVLVSMGFLFSLIISITVYDSKVGKTQRSTKVDDVIRSSVHYLQNKNIRNFNICVNPTQSLLRTFPGHVLNHGITGCCSNGERWRITWKCNGRKKMLLDNKYLNGDFRLKIDSRQT